MVRQIVNEFGMLLEYFSFFYVIFRVDLRQKSKKRMINIMVCLMAVIVSRMIGINLDKGLIVPMFLFVIDIMIYELFDVTIMETIVMGFAEWMLLCMVEMTFLTILDHFTIEKTLLDTIIWGLVTCCIWIFYILIGKRINSRTYKLPLKAWIILDSILFILTMMMSFFSYVLLSELPDNKMVFTGKVLSAVGELLISILIFILIYYYKGAYDLQVKKDFAELQNIQQKEYFNQLLEKEEETRNFRHEIINDLLEMQNYCEKGNYQQLEVYLESTLGAINKISQKNYDVGSDILNTILNYYLLPIKDQYHVEVCGYVDESVSIEQRDLCILCSNLVKNAVEAVSKLDTGEIRFSIEQGRDYLCIQLSNTYAGKIVYNRKGLPKTTKADTQNHGIGLHNVRQIVKKYEGNYHVETIDGKYQVVVFLKL